MLEILTLRLLDLWITPWLLPFRAMSQQHKTSYILRFSFMTSCKSVPGRQKCLIWTSQLRCTLPLIYQKLLNGTPEPMDICGLYMRTFFNAGSSRLDRHAGTPAEPRTISTFIRYFGEIARTLLGVWSICNSINCSKSIASASCRITERTSVRANIRSFWTGSTHCVICVNFQACTMVGLTFWMVA